MKTIKLMKWWLYTILMCACLTSCSNSDDKEGDFLKSKIIGEWYSYQTRGWHGGEIWEDCAAIAKITFYSDGHYIFESFNPETGKPTGTCHNESYEFNEDDTEMYDGSDWCKIIISTEELDYRPFDPTLVIFSNDFKRMKFLGWKLKKI